MQKYFKENENLQIITHYIIRNFWCCVLWYPTITCDFNFNPTFYGLSQYQAFWYWHWLLVLFFVLFYAKTIRHASCTIDSKSAHDLIANYRLYASRSPVLFTYFGNRIILQKCFVNAQLYWISVAPLYRFIDLTWKTGILQSVLLLKLLSNYFLGPERTIY